MKQIINNSSSKSYATAVKMSPYEDQWYKKFGSFLIGIVNGRKDFLHSCGVVGLSMVLITNVPAVHSDPALNALPTGYQSVAGNVEFNQAGNTLNVSSQANSSIANYQTFNVGQNATVNFNLPSSQSAILNRVTGGIGSEIFGSINSNGRVFLVNPSGVLFGSTAQVNVGSLVTSTLNTSNKNFLEGNYVFDQGSNSLASIVNQGKITAKDGSVVLLGGAIQNTGSINAPNGSIQMAVGKSATITMEDGVNVDVQINEALEQKVEGVQSAISNTGSLSANSIKAQANLNGAIYEQAINNAGLIQATGFKNKNGEIILIGQTNDKTANVINTGNLLATSETGKGGNIKVLGDNIGIFSGKLDVSGKTGGGEILIGGDYQGKNSEIYNAQKTYIGKDVEMKANATETGNGGKIINWADQTTWFYGSAEAKGGSQSGNGGFVEISGKQGLRFDGKVNTTAKNGETGTVLFDPRNIFITTNPAIAPDIQVNAFNFSELTNNSDTVNDYYVSSANLLTLAAGTNISLSANNDIFFNDALSLTGTQSIFANAGNDIFVNANLSAVDGTIGLLANNNITVNNSTIANTATGNLNLTPTGNLNLTATNGQISVLGNSVLQTTPASNINLNTNWLNIDPTASIITNNLNIIPVANRNILVGGAATDNATTIAISQAELGTFNVKNLNIGSNTNVGNINLAGNISLPATNLDLRTQGAINLVGNSINVFNNNVSLTAAGSGNQVLINNDILGNNITITADRFLLDTNTSAVINGANSVTIQPLGDTSNILGGGQNYDADLVTNTFNLSNSELSRITSPNLTIGSASSGGGLTVNNDFYKDTNLTLRNRDFIDVQNNITLPENIIAPTNTANSITLTSNNIYIPNTVNIKGGIDADANESTIGLSSEKALMRATLHQATNGTAIDLGGADSGTFAAGPYNLLGITDAEIDRISSNTIQVGNNSSGNMIITSVINPNLSPTLDLESGQTITDTTGYIEEANLAIRAVGNVTLDNVNNDVNNLSGNISGLSNTFTFLDKNDLTISTVDNLAGLTTNNGNINVSTINGNLVVDNTAQANDVNAGIANINLTAGTTDPAIDTKIQVQTGARVNGSNITLTAQDLQLDGNVIASQRATVQNFSPNTQIDLGSITDATPNVLEISNAELNRITANIIQVGNTTNTGAINITDNMTVTGAPTMSVRSTDNINDNGSGKINNSNLNLELIGQNVQLDNTANDVLNLAGRSTNGSFTFLDANDLTINSVDSSTGITANNGDIILKSGTGTGDNLIVNQPVQATGNITLVAGGDLNINSLVKVDTNNTGNETLALQSLNGSITQSGVSPIEGGNNNILIALAQNNITLENNNNDFGKIALKSNNGGNITYTDLNSVEIASGTSADITAPPFTVTGINTTGTTGLKISGTGDLTQSEVINSNNFAALSNNGNIILNNSDNQVSVVALTSNNGEIKFISSQDLSIGEITTTNTGTITGITANGNNASGGFDVSVESGGSLSIDEQVSATKNISLISNNDLIINDAQILVDSNNNNSGADKATLYLESKNGSITQSPTSTTGIIGADDIVLGKAKNNIDLLSTQNNFGEVAFVSESGGNINYVDADGFTISAGLIPNTTDTISGISTVNGYVGLAVAGAGNINQNRIINAKGLAATTFDGNITLNIPNEVQEVAFNADGSGDIEFTNKNGFNITTVNTNATGIVNGITALDNKVKLRVSEAGNISQDQAIQSNELSIINPNGNIILNNTNNDINVLAVKADKGNLEFTDLDGFGINTIDNIGGLKVNGNIQLITGAGNITQGSGDANSVNGNLLNIITDSGNATLNNTSNNVNTFKTTSQSGNIELFDNAGLSVLASNTGSGNLTITSKAGNLDLLGNLNAKNINLSTINGGNINLNSTNLTGQNGIYINSSGNINAAGRDNYPKLTAPEIILIGQKVADRRAPIGLNLGVLQSGYIIDYSNQTSFGPAPSYLFDLTEIRTLLLRDGQFALYPIIPFIDNGMLFVQNYKGKTPVIANAIRNGKSTDIGGNFYINTSGTYLLYGDNNPNSNDINSMLKSAEDYIKASGKMVLSNNISKLEQSDFIRTTGELINPATSDQTEYTVYAGTFLPIDYSNIDFVSDKGREVQNLN